MNPLIGDRITLVKGDITGIRADAIVNAANSSLLGGGGVDGRIHQVAGPELLEECRGLGGCEPGSAAITRGYRLPARHVIHAVGPVYRDGKSGEPQLLAGCYRAALRLAAENGCTSVAFPAISCGAYGYPLIEAAKIAFAEVVQGLRRYPDLRVYFVLYDQRSYDVYRQIHQAVLNTPAESRP